VNGMQLICREHDRYDELRAVWNLGPAVRA
jgi:hypothetical protein